jgi:hypothetical protein
VHIKPRAALNDDVHHVPPFQTTRHAGSEGPPVTTLRFALEAAVNGAAGPRAILTNGLTAPRRCRRRPIRRRHSHPATVAAAPPRLLTMRCERQLVAPISNWSQPAATVLACLGRSGAQSICAGLPPVAATGLHEGSMPCCPRWLRPGGVSITQAHPGGESEGDSARARRLRRVRLAPARARPPRLRPPPQQWPAPPCPRPQATRLDRSLTCPRGVDAACLSGKPTRPTRWVIHEYGLPAAG